MLRRSVTLRNRTLAEEQLPGWGIVMVRVIIIPCPGTSYFRHASDNLEVTRVDHRSKVTPVSPFAECICYASLQLFVIVCKTRTF